MLFRIVLFRIGVAVLATVSILAAAPPPDFARLTADGHAALQRQQWSDAAGAFQKAVALVPGDAAAHFGLALAWRGAGRTAEAIQEARTALKLQPGFDDAQLLLGVLLQQTGDTVGAAAQYQSVIRRNPKSAEAHNWLGVLYMQKNQLPDAVAELRTAVRLQPGFVRAWNNLGSTLAQSGDLTEGIAAFREGLKHAPGDFPMQLNLGAALRSAGDAESALAVLRSVAAKDPDNPEIHYQTGLALRDAGDVAGAIRELESALTLNPEYREGYYALAQTLRQMAGTTRGKTSELPPAVARGLEMARSGNLGGALDQFRGAASERPESAEAHYHLGAALWYSGDREGAARELDLCLSRDPAMSAAYSLRGVAYRESGDWAGAQRMFQRAIALSPNAPVSYFDLGVVFLQRKQMEQALGMFEAGLNLPAPEGAPADLQVAVEELRTVIAAKPNAEAYNVLGRLLGYAGADAQDVSAAFEQAIQLRPDFPEAHNHLGLVHLQAGDDAKALASFRAAIRLRPEFADAHANLGAMLTATDAAGSVKELERALQLQPGLLKARFNLAIAYGASPSHGIEREIAELRKLIGLQADYPRAEFALGRALLRKGAVAEAVEHLSAAVRAEPGYGEAQYQLGLALSRAGRTGEAAKWLKQGRERIAEAQREQMALLDLKEGAAALEKEQIDQAVVKLRSATRQRPDVAQGHYLLGMALSRKGDAGAARASFEETVRLQPAHAGARAALERTAFPDELARFESYVRDGRFADVEPLVAAYLKEHPALERAASARAWYILGYSQFVQKKVGDCIRSLAKSLSLDVSNADAHKVLGRALMLIGRFDAARKEFETGETLAPKSAEMPFNLGRLFSIQDQWADARGAFERAVALDPGYMEAWDGLGFAQEALGDDVRALESYQRAEKLNDEKKGDFATPCVNLSAYYGRLGQTDRALTYAQRAVAVNRNSDRAWFQLARAQERKGALDEAAAALRNAVSINPRASSYHYVLATIYRRLGKTEQSREAMQTFSKLDRETNEIERRRREGMREAGASAQ